MTLNQLLSAQIPSLEILRETWLVFPADFAPILEAAQVDQTALRVAPIQLADNRLALCADLLSEIQPGGAFAVPFSRLPSELFASVEVIDAATFNLLLPPTEL